MYPKTMISTGMFALYLVLAFLSCGTMLLIPHVNPYVGVGVGAGICIALTVLTAVGSAREWRHAFVPIAAGNGIGSGIALSSLFVFLGHAPAVTDYFIAFALLLAAFLLYCLLTYLPFVRRYPVPCMIVYAVLACAGYIVLVCLAYSCAFLITAIFLLPFIGFFVSIARRAEFPARQLEHVAGASCFSVAVVVILVLLIISQGEASDGMSDILPTDIYGGGKRKYNPYDFDL